MPAPYFTPAELRTMYPDVTSATYPDVLVDQYRLIAEEAFEAAADVAFVPRTSTATLSGDGGSILRLPTTRLSSITSVTADGTVVDVTVAKVEAGSYAYLPAGWAAGTQNIVITYTHGFDAPPLRVKQAVMALAREWMLSGPVTDRQTGIPVEGGGTISLAAPGGRFGTFGMPEVDATVAQYRVETYI